MAIEGPISSAPSFKSKVQSVLSAIEIPNGHTQGKENGHVDGRVNGVPHTNGSHATDYHVPLNNSFAWEPRKVRVVTIGAGFSGLLIAHKFQHRFPEMQEFVEHKIFEARSDVGGTWLANNYPGCQCDVPAHTYAFPFDPNPNWSRFYASSTEIQAYIKSTVRKWNLDRDIHLRTRILAAHWKETSGMWELTVKCDGQQRIEICDILISSAGVLVEPSWPKVPGLKSFKGHITHSAEWDHNFDYANKSIAVIGNGSSGIQIVPQMAKLPGTTVKNFARGPAWVYYRLPPSQHQGGSATDLNPAYSEDDIKRFQDTVAHQQYRKGIISRTNKAFRLFLKGDLNESHVERARAQMSEKLNHDPVLCEQLIPKWELGCRRVTPGPGYLESFLKDNCTLTTSAITEVTETGIRTADGQTFECDVIVCATGFNVSHCPRYPLVGRDDVDLRDKWRDEPESYLSIATDGFPNFFIMMGPNCLGGHGSLVESLNWTGDLFVRLIKKIATEDIKCMAPKTAAVKSFVKYGDEIHKTLVWTGSCSSWYKRGSVDGRVTALFGGSAFLFRRLIQDIRGEDWDISYKSENEFRFMGNGFTEWELQEDSDLAWYVEVADREAAQQPQRRMMESSVMSY